MSSQIDAISADSVRSGSLGVLSEWQLSVCDNEGCLDVASAA